MNQGKLKVVKKEMARVDIDILAIGELKWTRMGEFNSSHGQLRARQDECIRWPWDGILPPWALSIRNT